MSPQAADRSFYAGPRAFLNQQNDPHPPPPAPQTSPLLRRCGMHLLLSIPVRRVQFGYGRSDRYLAGFFGGSGWPTGVVRSPGRNRDSLRSGFAHFVAKQPRSMPLGQTAKHAGSVAAPLSCRRDLRHTSCVTRDRFSFACPGVGGRRNFGQFLGPRIWRVANTPATTNSVSGSTCVQLLIALPQLPAQVAGHAGEHFSPAF